MAAEAVSLQVIKGLLAAKSSGPPSLSSPVPFLMAVLHENILKIFSKILGRIEPIGLRD